MERTTVDKMLAQPIRIKSMELKNRIGMAPFLNNPVGDGGEVTDLTIRWFEARAKGGSGLIMTGAISPTTFAQDTVKFLMGGRLPGLALYEDRFIPGFTKLAEVIHSYGAKIGVQIAVVGPMGGTGMSPGPYPDPTHAKDSRMEAAGIRIPVKELTVEELQRIEDDIAACAARAKAAGIDCVELHCAHGGATLGCAAISPFYNRRTDQYGGSWEGRLRFPTETIKKMRAAVGEDYPIFVRISADELLGERGITLADTVEYIVPALEAAGVDCFDVSQGSILHAPEGITIPTYYHEGCFIHHAAAVKGVTKRPVIGVGAIFDLEMAERFLQEGKADIIYMGRQTTADPETPRKYFEGRTDEIRKCIGCAAGCGRPCTINYDIQDNPIPLEPAEKPKRVLIIGGGVAGMEAARVATLRGHRVTLMEKDAKLGGMVGVLALNPLTSEFGNIVDYLGSQMRKLGVDVRACKEATLADVEAMRPDVVILAAGSADHIPEAAQGKPGVMTHSQASRAWMAIGQRVVVWGFFGVELAIWLAEQGKDVVLIGRGGEGALASDISSARRFWILRKVTDLNLVRGTPEAQRLNNLKVMYHIQVEKITAEGIHTVDNEGTKRILPYDTLILSRRFGERKANDALFEELQGKVAEVYKIGDCDQVKGILEAITTANEVARKI